MLWKRLAAIAVVAAFSCGPRPAPTHPDDAALHALKGLPPRTDPPIDLDDDDDLERERADFGALALDDAGRGEKRAALWRAYQTRIERRFADDDRERAFAVFQNAIALWHPSELDALDAPAPGLELAVPLAEDVLRRFSATGNHVEALTALAVIRAARPHRAEELERAYDEIVEYADDLAMAEETLAARRKRPIDALEQVTEHFPSRWAGEKLVALYVDRQLAVQSEVTQPRTGARDVTILGVQHTARIPTWLVIRAFARMGRIADAIPVVDAMSGQTGDMPEVRALLRESLAQDGTAAQLRDLAAALFLNDSQGLFDARAALRICETAAARYPEAPEPRELAARVAASQRNVPLAIRWAEEAAARAKGDPEILELVSRLYVFRINTLVFAERIDAGRKRLDEMIEFQKKNPHAETMADAYFAMGRGHYNVGEIDRAIEYLTQATQVKKTPDVLEQLGTIALKRGRWQEAVKRYEEAAAIEREEPLDDRMEKARLRRLAGEAWLRGGDRGRAETQFMNALDAWVEIVTWDLDRPQLALARTELGRLHYHLGHPDDAIEHFERAVDADPEQASVYADVIAFLFTRGRYEAALDAWHRGVHRSEVTEYFKIYTTLWVGDLARIRGEKPDAFANDYLASRDGRRWYHELARFGSGRLGYEQLLERADTRGKRAEAFFYEAMNRYARGDRAGAETLLRRVVATDMLGFFEYDMATYFLEHGPPR